MEQWLDKTCGRKGGEERLAEENRWHKTIDCLIHEVRGVSFNAVDDGPHSWDQPMRAIMGSRCPGSVTEGQEKEPVLQPPSGTELWRDEAVTIQKLLRLVKAISEKDERRNHPVQTSAKLVQDGRVVWNAHTQCWVSHRLLRVGRCCKLPRDSGKQSVMVYKNGGRKYILPGIQWSILHISLQSDLTGTTRHR